MKATNNKKYKYWIGSSNPNMKNSSNCLMKQPIDFSNYI